jgi:spore coat polysaccharide biosynthesis protein SpsF (cytidylyltransferase family)
MPHSIAVVEARLELEHLRATLVRKLGARSLLELVVRRVTDCARIDGVVVLVVDEAEAGIARELVPSDVPVRVASAPETIGRFVEMLDEYRPDGVVRVRAENPFIEPEFIDHLVTAAAEEPGCDYVGYRLRDGRPAAGTSLGLFAEWCCPEALRRVARLARTPADRDGFTQYMVAHPGAFSLRFLPAPAGLDRDDLRLTVESEEDWLHAEVIYEALGPDEFDWKRIARLLNGQPRLRERMARLNRDFAPAD